MNLIICSIVIVNWKSFSYLLECINSIKKNTQAKYEIIVVDNASDDKEQHDLKMIDGIVLIQNTENIGFAAANNQGFKIAIGEFVLMLNPDTIVLKNSIDKMINFLNSNQTVHAIGPKLYYSDQFDYHPSMKQFPTPFSQLMKMLPISSLFCSWKYRFKVMTDKISRVDCVWGAAIMFRKAVFQTIGYFDESFFLYAEELDFCKRMSIAGLKIYYFPKAEIIHYGGISQKKSLIPKNIMIWKSLLIYFDKYFSERNIRRNMNLLLLFLKSEVFLFKRYELQNVIDVIEKKLNTH
jgi:GT2 family glycosyltransferase